MSVECIKIETLSPAVYIVEWPVSCSQEKYEEFVNRLRRLKRREDTLIVVTPEKIHPLICYAAYIHALDAYKSSRNKAKTLDLETLIIIYGNTQIGKLLSEIRYKIAERNSYNVCILYRGIHPGSEYLPEPPVKPSRCNKPKLTANILGKLESIVANYLSAI
ncbi:MAG: hypothetical protein GSR79_02220 [Desulfurococcales archaeon]|nr:hypothetical protein [Desulfurococcales archaeon]